MTQICCLLQLYDDGTNYQYLSYVDSTTSCLVLIGALHVLLYFVIN